MRFRMAALITATALALAALPAAAQGFGPPAHDHARGTGNPMVHMMKELDLSEAQTAQVKTITAKYMEGTLGEAMGSMHRARATVHKTIHDVATTDDQVREAAAVVAVLESQIAVQHHQMAVEISGVLTPDQRAKLTAMFASVAERRHGPKSGGPDGF